ncbi:MAG: Asp-tRNA(Asn)/Glu-tRNA(Gln) amidotransferase subunit GatA [Alphaproteobacteria bacterium]|nr:MAG: Asp-tRNA(Asn)/Glu-tRNA(Gln) amidotransferase subunit GatA [Alphaproteobacteria bacterium]
MSIDLTLSEAKKALRKKEISAVELTKAYLKRIEDTKHLNMYITVTEEQALKMAQESDVRIGKGEAKPLDGIPIGMKDLFCTKDTLTTSGSKMLSNFKPPYESTVSQKLWDAGGVMLGKTNMDEFAMGSSNLTSYYGPAISPIKRTNEPEKDLVPGGSSGGSSAAVAAKACLVATGSDTGGSIRQPASFCGIVGIKPTYGLCSRYGMLPLASSLDQAGILARNVLDAAIALENMIGYDPKDATSLDVPVQKYSDKINPDMKGKKIVVFEEFFHGLDEEIKVLYEDLIKKFEAAGATVETKSYPSLDVALPIYYILQPAEASSNLAKYDGVKYGYRTKSEFSSIEEMYELTRAEGFGEEVQRRILMGAYVLSASHYDAYYTRARVLQSQMRQYFKELFKVYDYVLSPSAPSDAFAISEKPDDPKQMYLYDIYTVPANLAGLPGISIPYGTSKRGGPLGMQLMGPKCAEQSLFDGAKFIEEVAK